MLTDRLTCRSPHVTHSHILSKGPVVLPRWKPDKHTTGFRSTLSSRSATHSFDLQGAWVADPAVSPLLPRPYLGPRWKRTKLSRSHPRTRHAVVDPTGNSLGSLWHSVTAGSTGASDGSTGLEIGDRCSYTLETTIGHVVPSVRQEEPSTSQQSDSLRPAQTPSHTKPNQTKPHGTGNTNAKRPPMRTASCILCPRHHEAK